MRVINHPEKGDNLTVEPIRKQKDVASIMKLLSDNPRDYLLFVMGINNGLRVGDLLALRVRDVKDLKPGQTITIRESKTGKTNIVMVNKTVHKALKAFLDEVKPSPGAYLFASRKGGKALTTASVNHLVKRWTAGINLKGNYGAHSLRKTFGYHQRMHFGVGFEILCKRFNHSSPTVTMRYLGIEDKEVTNILLNEIG